MADGGSPVKRPSHPLPTGWPRPTAGLERRIERRTGLTSPRQWALVGLALGGVAVGYVLGLATAPDGAPPSRELAAKTVELPEAAATPAGIEPPSKPLADPDADSGDPIGNKLRAIMPQVSAGEEQATKVLPYEEPLPQDVVVHHQPMPRPPHAAAPAPPPVPITAATRAQPTLPPPLPVPSGDAAETPGSEAPAWRRNALAVPPIGDEPVVVVVMDDLGVDRARTTRTAALDGPLTLSFMTYARDVQAQVDHGRANGHEIMMHVPMEPSSPDVDPGPNVLLSGMPEAELRAALDWALAQFDGYTGINNHMGSRFTEDAEALRVVMGELKRRGLLFLDSLTSQNSHAGEQAQAAGVPYAVRNVFIDHTDGRAAVRHQLATTARIAKETGSAIAIGHPRDDTLAELEPWIAGLEEQGLRLVPLSALIEKQHDALVATAKAKASPANVAKPVEAPSPAETPVAPPATSDHHP